MIEQSHRFTSDVVEMLFSGFCPVSGSPVFPGPNKRYAVALRDKDGRKYSGLAYLCCMPCSCDMEDLIKIDTKTLPTK